MAIKVERQIVVSVDGFPSCAWYVNKETTVGTDVYGEVDFRHVDHCAAAHPRCVGCVWCDSAVFRAACRLQLTRGTKFHAMLLGCSVQSKASYAAEPTRRASRTSLG